MKSNVATMSQYHAADIVVQARGDAYQVIKHKYASARGTTITPAALRMLQRSHPGKVLVL